MSLPVSDCKLPVARLLLPLFQSLFPSFSLLLLPLVHPLSPFSIHPSRLCVPPSQLTLILFPPPTFPLLAAIINKKTARKPPFHRSPGRSSYCYVLRLPSVTACPSVSLSLLLRQSVQYIQTGRSVYKHAYILCAMRRALLSTRKILYGCHRLLRAHVYDDEVGQGLSLIHI